MTSPTHALPPAPGVGRLAARTVRRIVEPAAVTTVDGFQVASWPDVHASPAELVALRLPLPLAVGTRYLRNGWQSWSVPTMARLGDPPAARPHAAGLAPRHPYGAAPAAGDESYDVLVADGFVAGVLAGGALFVARADVGDLLVVREGPGPHPDVWSACGDGPATLRRLLDRCAPAPGLHPLRGWSSWSAYRTAVTAAAVTQVARAGPALPGMQVLSIDDGWQAAVGDWDRPRETFPGGVAAAADTIRANGLRAGIWLAPFIATAGSRLVQQRPDWLLRAANGAPVVAMSSPQWTGDAYALDVTRPDVLAWTHDVVAGLVADGFSYLKLDFLYAAALAGRHRRPAPADHRVRAALQAVRAAAGPQTYLVGCGAPLWPAIGLVDAMRVGPDVDDRLHADPGHPDPRNAACLANATRSAVLRRPFHGRLWINDPDAVQLAAVPEPTYGAARRAAARRAAHGGEMLFWSDRLGDLDQSAVTRWAELSALHAG